VQADIVQAGDEFSKALMLAVQRGDIAEDDSQGQALAHDPALRAIQERFVLNSPVWSDRNKASGALAAFSKERDPQLLARLRNEAIAPLVEMARWKGDGHAIAAFIILGRIAGYSDEAAQCAWDRGEREVVISDSELPWLPGMPALPGSLARFYPLMGRRAIDGISRLRRHVHSPTEN
jgi:hypothetical protein